MTDEAGIYRERAAWQRADAETASLDNVRDRCVRAAIAWEAMADRAERVGVKRREREAAATARHEVGAGA
jgi:hypothetical protein